jgi:hypothetical protein
MVLDHGVCAWQFNRIGDEGSLMGKARVVGDVIFIKPCDNAVAVFCDELVELFLFRPYPLFPILQGICIGPEGTAYIEITIPQGFCFDTGLDPIRIHPIGSEKYVPVVSAKVMVNRPDPFRLDLKEHGIDDLYDIIPLQMREKAI